MLRGNVSSGQSWKKIDKLAGFEQWLNFKVHHSRDSDASKTGRQQSAHVRQRKTAIGFDWNDFAAPMKLPFIRLSGGGIPELKTIVVTKICGPTGATESFDITAPRAHAEQVADLFCDMLRSFTRQPYQT
ncbi:hypothetical protein HNQ77_001474 [Silvibacterium bohemicum]|uniref:Uncharacterized protein n=1 Tax=Silvibacterium bohemicum TaxID=1577686 RepID=A0A841JSS7_9BACT|nr:hypothetical protein [Silvibacterium bohemicum]MBB6143525.1 hypothetical protein [Silvibacterium bohemicum]